MLEDIALKDSREVGIARAPEVGSDVVELVRIIEDEPPQTSWIRNSGKLGFKRSSWRPNC